MAEVMTDDMVLEAEPDDDDDSANDAEIDGDLSSDLTPLHVGLLSVAFE